MVDLNSLGQSLGVPAVALAGHMAALATAEARGREVTQQQKPLDILFCRK